MQLRIHETPSGICTLEGWPKAVMPPDRIEWVRPNGQRLAIMCLDSQITRRQAWLYVVDESDRPLPEVE